ncbi:MAG: hypothetical protein J5585_09925 [Clostridia bacterium]|nr:hypothetical protein [Clostridia bacterium]
MINKRRLSAVILTALVFAVVMTSLFVVAHGADHDCTGDNCPVCALISVCRSTLKTLAGAAAAAAVFALVRAFSDAVCLCRAAAKNKTPIQLKVKLLD